MTTSPTSVSSSMLGSLQLARTALAAQQATLDTIGHNLANAQTEGYTRQRVELVPLEPRRGVDVAAIRRVRDRFLDVSLLTEQQTLGKHRAEDTILQRLEGIVNEPADTGLSAGLDQLFASFEALSRDPTDQAARVSLRDKGREVADTVRSLRSDLVQLEDDLTTEMRDRVDTANQLASELASLHRQIIAARNGPPPNDLLDRRDTLVGKLNEVIGVSATDRDDGTVQLAIAGTGVLLVDGDRAATLTASLDESSDAMELTVGDAALAVTPRAGALAAIMDIRNTSTGPLKEAIADVDDLAGALAREVNRLHSRGAGLTGFDTLTSANAASASDVALADAGLPDTPVDGDFRLLVHDATGAVVSDVTVAIVAGTTTLDALAATLDAVAGLSATVSDGRLTLTADAGDTFAFGDDSSHVLSGLGLNTFFTGSDGATLALADAIANDAARIAAARADADGLAHPGDGANALALARLRTSRVMTDATQTFGEFRGASLARTGSRAREASQASERQAAAVETVQGLQQQTSGVSIDEELINLTTAQTAYAAAAKWASAIDDVLQTLLGLAD